MIEDALFLALGFCVATVLALACLPILWTRALRLTRQRLELLVPWSRQEIDAERDGWRAQAAVQQRRLEQEAEKSRRALAGREIALGHRTASLSRVEAVRDELDAVRRALLADLAVQATEMRDSEGQRGALEKALHDADRRIETDAAEAREQAHRYDRLSALAEERRGAVAALETRVAGLQAQVEDRDDSLAKMTTDLAETTATKTSVAADLEAERAALTMVTAARDELAHALADERARAEERDSRLRQRTDALTKAEIRMAEQETALTRQADELATLQRRFEALQRGLQERQGGEDPDRDAALRSALVAAGDDALRLLAPDQSHAAADRPATSELVKERP